MNNLEVQVILIETDSITNFINREILKKIGVSHIKVFTSTIKAIDYIKTNNMSSTFIFIDIYMPIIDGFEFINELKKIEIETSIFFSSNTIDPEHILKAEDKKIKIIHKPLTESMFKELLCE